MKANDRLELVKVLLGGGVLALLAISYLLLVYTGRDPQGRSASLAWAWGTRSVVAEVELGEPAGHPKKPFLQILRRYCRTNLDSITGPG